MQPKLFVGHNDLSVLNSCVELGITVVTDNLTHRVHINNIVAKAHKQANGAFEFESKNSSSRLRSLFVYIRPILEYNSILWSSHYKQNIEAIECVQPRFTKRLPGLRLYTYLERLKILPATILGLH